MHLRSILLSSMITLLASGCHVTRRPASHQVEVVDLTLRIFNPADSAEQNPLEERSSRVWVQDSFAIEEIRFVKSFQAGNQQPVFSYALKGYRFSDLKRAVYYNFTTFSDTSACTGVFSYRDTVPKWGGWIFFNNRSAGYCETPLHITDTILRGKVYKRMSGRVDWLNQPIQTISYFDCERKGTFFDMDTALSRGQMNGCPLVKTYSYPVMLPGPGTGYEIQFVRNELTEEEERVFVAWILFARNIPYTTKKENAKKS